MQNANSVTVTMTDEQATEFDSTLREVSPRSLGDMCLEVHRLGRVFLTEGARKLNEAGWTAGLVRHHERDWSDQPRADRGALKAALKSGAQLCSMHLDINTMITFLVITDAVESGKVPRRRTTILLPDEY